MVTDESANTAEHKNRASEGKMNPDASVFAFPRYSLLSSGLVSDISQARSSDPDDFLFSSPCFWVKLKAAL